VALEPVTGRSHQLRVHLQAIGHAILGDMLYASPQVAELSGRLLLHACMLELTHPVHQQTIQFVSPAPF
jgi:tRNA pseudouridine32 synthase/23S rRNA pseudouridine746 synthase